MSHGSLFADSIFHTCRIGECDICHNDEVELYGFEDDEPGEWRYCGPCADKQIARANKKQEKAY